MEPSKAPATALASSPSKSEPRNVREALNDRMYLSEAIAHIGSLLDRWPNGRKGVADGYIGGLAACLCDYPRAVALRCCEVKGVARKTKFLPTIADVAQWCERETAAMRSPVDREDHYARIQAGMAQRREATPRAERESFAELRARLGPTFGLQPMDDSADRRRNVDEIQRANHAAWARAGGTVSGGIQITEALTRTLKREDPCDPPT